MTLKVHAGVVFRLWRALDLSLAQRREGQKKRSSRLDLRVPDRLPDLHRRDRGLDRGDAEIGKRIHHAVGDARWATDRTGFAAALGTQRIGAARRGTVERDFNWRHVVGARNAVVLVARGDQLALAAVGHAFIERLADALRDAAMHLPGHQHRVDGDTDIVHRGVAHHARDTGLRIDLDLADVGAVRPARAVGLAFAVDGEPCARFLFGNVEQADMLVGADDGERTVAVFDILDGRLP